MRTLFLLILTTATLAMGTEMPSLTEVRGPIFAQELARCLPADMHTLVIDTLNTMQDLHPERAPGTSFPLDKEAWFAQHLIKYMTGGQGFCEAYARTTSLATSRFSEHALHGAPLAEYRASCKARLSMSSNTYTRATGQGMHGPMTVENDPLVKCLIASSHVAEQARPAEPSRPVKK